MGFTIELRTCVCGSTISRPKLGVSFVHFREYTAAEAMHAAALVLEDLTDGDCPLCGTTGPEVHADSCKLGHALNLINQARRRYAP